MKKVIITIHDPEKEIVHGKISSMIAKFLAKEGYCTAQQFDIDNASILIEATKL